MNPYSRFRLVSNTAAAALLAGALCALWPVASGMLATAAGGLTPVYWAAVAGVAAGLVVTSLAMTEWIFPAIFQLGILRRLVLGRDYVEGTWLHAERGPTGSERLTVLHVRPSGYGFGLSGYCLNQECEIESNRMIEYVRLDGPVLSYAYRSLMPDGAGNQAKGVSELMFEQRRGAPKAYSGHGDMTGAARRFQIEGVKLTRWSERRNLRKLDQRAGVVETYWNLFFGTAHDAADDAAPSAIRRPVIVTAARPEAPSFVDRRNPDAVAEDDGPVITRRRASDWRSDDTTPTADRIRSRMMAAAEAAEEDEDDVLPEEDFEDEGAACEAGDQDEVALEAEVEDLDDSGFEDAADDAEDEFSAETDEDDEPALEDTEPKRAEEEPLRIRQRYARR